MYERICLSHSLTAIRSLEPSVCSSSRSRKSMNWMWAYQQYHSTVSTNNSKRLARTSETILKTSIQVVSKHTDSAIQPNDFKYSLAMRAVARSLLECAAACITRLYLQAHSPACNLIIVSLRCTTRGVCKHATPHTFCTSMPAQRHALTCTGYLKWHACRHLLWHRSSNDHDQIPLCGMSHRQVRGATTVTSRVEHAAL